MSESNTSQTQWNQCTSVSNSSALLNLKHFEVGICSSDTDLMKTLTGYGGWWRTKHKYFKLKNWMKQFDIAREVQIGCCRSINTLIEIFLFCNHRAPIWGNYGCGINYTNFYYQHCKICQYTYVSKPLPIEIPGWRIMWIP